MTTIPWRPLLITLALGIGAAGCLEDLSAPGRNLVAASATALQASAGAVRPGAATPEELLQRIARAVEAHDALGRIAYVASFCDSSRPATRAFRAYNDPAVLEVCARSTALPLPDPTGLGVERDFYTYFAALYPSFAYTFAWSASPIAPSMRIEARGEGAILRRGYRVVATSPDGTAHPVIAVGYADLELVRVAGRWQVSRWIDHVDPSVGVTPADMGQVTMGWRRLDSLQR